MNHLVSVVVCTHNPRSDYLQKTLESLRTQTLPKERWELVLVDNASRDILASFWDLSWHPYGRIVREEELGLTPARVRGVRESTGELLIFVDDDNVLADDYIEVAHTLAGRHKHIGAFGGSVKGNFEVPPCAWARPYLQSLALDEIDRDYWSNVLVWSKAVPFGAGLCARRCVAEDYVAKVTTDPRRRRLDRRGAGMGAGGDTDLAWCAIDLNMGTARFHNLRMIHMVPEVRLSEQYMVALQAGLTGSWLILESLRDTAKKRREPEWVEVTRLAWQMIRSSRIERAILLASRRTRREAFDVIWANNGDCQPR